MLFKDIPGNRELKAKLITSVKKNRISHAQIFSGSKGNAKLALAFAFARFINCEKKLANDSCGNCLSCLKYNTFSHPDLHLIFPVLKIGGKTTAVSDMFVDQWRTFISKNIYNSLSDWIETFDSENKKGQEGVIYKDEAISVQKKLMLKNFEALYRVFLIWMPEKMNLETSNKLLKVLEEPPSGTIFLLVSENPNKLLPTISSRLQRVKTKNFSSKDIFEFLQKKNVDFEKAEKLISLSGSDLGKIIQLLKDGIEDTSWLDEFSLWMRLVYKVDIEKISKWVDLISSKGKKNQKTFLLYAIKMIRECLIFNFANQKLLKINDEEREFISKFSSFIHEENSITIVQEMEKAINSINRNASAKILFFQLSLQMIKHIKVKRNVAIR